MHNSPDWFQQVYYNGKPVSGALLTSYTAGNTNIPCPVYYDVDRTTACPNPLQADDQGIFPQYYMSDVEYKFVLSTAGGITLATRDYVSPGGGGGSVVSDTYKVMTYSGDTTPDYLQNKLVAGNNMTISLSGSSLVLSAAATSADDHKVLVDGIDPTPGYLYDKVSPGPFVTISKTAGISGEAIVVAFQPVVSADGTDVAGYLIDKLSANDTPIGFESYNGRVNLTFDYAKASANLANTPYSVWFSSSDGKLQGSTSFTFGDPSRLGALYTPSLQVMGSAIMGNRAGFWDDQWFTMSYSATGGTVQLTPGYSNTKFIYAHNNENNASVATDKASFANLAQNGVVFASMLPNTSEDLIYLHTADGLSFNPTSSILTTPHLAIGSFSAAGVLTNDASGNVSSVPLATFADSQQVLVSSTDTAAGYLGSKLAAGTNISFSMTTDSRGQKLWISARSNMLLNPTYISANYTVTDTDTCIVNYASGSITLTMPAPDMTYNGRGIEIFNASPEIMYVVGGITFSAMMNYGMRFRCVRDYTQTWVWIQVG